MRGFHEEIGGSGLADEGDAVTGSGAVESIIRDEAFGGNQKEDDASRGPVEGEGDGGEPLSRDYFW